MDLFIVSFPPFRTLSGDFLRNENVSSLRYVFGSLALCYTPSVADTAQSTTSFHTCLYFAISSWLLTSMLFVTIFHYKVNFNVL